MPADIESFKRDLLESIKQMRAVEAARVSRIKLPRVRPSTAAHPAADPAKR